MRRLLPWLLLGLAASARAGETRPVGKLGDYASLNVCQCAKDPVCWGLLLEGYHQTVQRELSEIEAALPNRFFPNSMATALDRTDAAGNFLTVRCGPSHQTCDTERDELERRVIYTSFLSVAPKDAKLSTLFDPETWQISAPGEKLVQKARKCRPTLMRELVQQMRQWVRFKQP